MPGVSRIAFTVFGQNVYWYGIVIAAGVLLAAVLALYREKTLLPGKDNLTDFILILLPVSLVCARLYYVIFTWDAFKNDLWQVFNVRQGGMAIYGGILGGALAALWFTRKRRLRFFALADLVAPSLALGQAIGRWGNFFNQEAYGGAVASESLRFFPLAVYIEALGEWRYATFFYESAWCFLVLAALLLLERKGAFRRTGDLFLWYVALYGAERAVVEGLRSDSLYFGAVRVSQALSLLALACVALLFAYRLWRAKDGARLYPLAALVPFACAAFARGAWAPLTQTALLLGGAALMIFGYRRIPRVNE